MKLSKPTINECVDGKKHSWMILADETEKRGYPWEHRWCQKCGSLIQVTYDQDGQVTTVLNPDGSTYFVVPQILNIITKPNL